MIWGIGTDLVDIERIAEKIQKREGFLKLVFSEQEIKICESKPNKYESFAARFAAKEAFLKALGTGLDATFDLYQIEILNAENNAPYMRISKDFSETLVKQIGRGEYKLHVSLSHTKTIATASVIIELT